jgi:peptidoglycan/xylan/chitin deacetylase (PgdA/CDA1 family)
MLGYWLPSTTTISERARRRYGVDARIESDGVALTFDDGPHPDGTPLVLDALEGVQATFFLVGEQVERRPELAARIAAEGHAIGVHCFRHRNLLRLGPRAVRSDLERAAAAIADATGREPMLYRPPYGILNRAAVEEARRRGWRILLWSRQANDWSGRATAQSIADRITENVEPGDVLLLHDADFYSAAGSWERTAAALPQVLARLRARGLEPVLP